MAVVLGVVLAVVWLLLVGVVVVVVVVVVWMLLVGVVVAAFAVVVAAIVFRCWCCGRCHCC